MADDDGVTRLPVKFRDRAPDERSVMLVREVEPVACDHTFAQYIVDPGGTEVECSRCRAKLNPMWVLMRLANEDRRYVENQKAAKAMAARLDERSRTKCRHCGKMTPISRR